MMPRFEIDLPATAYERLCEEAVSEYRPVDMHAVVMLIRALGLSLPEAHDNLDTDAAELTRSA